MYKRSGSKNAFIYKEPKAKMQKLDISVCAGSSQPSTSKRTVNVQLLQPSQSKLVAQSNDKLNAASSSAHSNNKVTAIQSPKRAQSPINNDSLWADADDELILIASQAVDKLDVIRQQIIVQSMDLSQNNAVETNKNGSDAKALKDLLHSTEEEDRLFSELQNFDNIGNINDNIDNINEFLNLNSLTNGKTHQVEDQRQGSPSVFKIPTQISRDKRTNLNSDNQNDANFSFRPESRPQSTQITERTEIPKSTQNFRSESKPQGQNLQVKFLTQQQCDLRKEIDYMQSENQRLTDQCQIKDGESSLLRSENERLKNLFDNLRREKSSEIAKIKIENATKVSDLQKEILALNSQLQFKLVCIQHQQLCRVHLVSLKAFADTISWQMIQKHLHGFVEMSTKQQQFRKFSSSQSTQSLVNSNLEASVHPWLKFKLLKKTCISPVDTKPVDPRIFISSNVRSSIGSSIYDRKQLEYLNGLQHILANMMNQKYFRINEKSKMLEEALKLALLSAVEMHRSSMVVQLKAKKNEFSLTHDEICNLKIYSVVDENKLFHNEEAFLSRRILICLATFCEQFPEFSSMLFKSRCDDDAEQNESFLKILSLTLESICHNRNIANLQGFVESSCVLLTFLASNCDINNLESISTTANVLHNVLLCRPGIRSLELVSKFLELASYRCRTNDFFNTLCSNRTTIDVIEPLALIKYTSNTCTLQIYALLIRLTILPHEERKFRIEQLTAITKSILVFMQNSFLKSPKWLLAENCSNCVCRGRLFGAIVTLLYMCFFHWIENPDEIDFQTISKLAELGVEFFYENFCKHFENIILNAGGTVIKNRVRVIVNWLNFYDFQFKSPHQLALQCICLQRLEPMVEHLRYNKNMSNNFVEESREVYKSVVDSFFENYD